ncbi:DNA damage-regulated autophagy modulator protein 2 [Clonorchis sinensis]|uniref:DNA damage-regulated autophagy modulator protein 2 n=1 Tax=Clonorchis sinensis TaxID=79923 RepID=G7Y653_CLOSI|nr:DNA damage-regulated autophagy modulator protein 2 [Clonorchis sinensis]
MCSRIFGLHIVPILLCFLMGLAFVISYAMAASLDHISILFPYISDTGTWVPESCIFGQLLNMAATLSAVSAYLWYKQANARLIVSLRPLMRCRCRAALCFGLLSSLGISLVANFQETAVWAVHLTGAALLYCCGLVYFAIVTNVSHHYLDSKQWALRVVLCTCATISAVILPVTGTVARFMYDGKNIRKWTPEDRGYVYHAVSSFAEWVLAICCLGFSLTMVAELKDYSILAVKLKHHGTRHSRESTITLTE